MRHCCFVESFNPYVLQGVTVQCLSNLYRALFWLLPFLLFTCFSSSVYSSQCPAGYPSSTPIQKYCTGGLCAYSEAPTPELSCSKAASNNFWGANKSGTAISATQCQVKNQDGSNLLVSPIALYSGSCPDGYVNTGTQCTCEEACPESGSFFGSGFVEGSGSSGCSNNCSISSGGSCISSNDPITGTVTSNWCSGWTFTGSSCSGDDVTGANAPEGVPSENGGRPTKPSDCPPQTGYAEVNGIASCLPSSSTYTGGSSTSTDSVTGNTTTTNTTTTINSDGGRSTTTTTNVYDSGGNLISSGSTTQTGSSIGDGSGSIGPINVNVPELDFGSAPNFDDTLPGESNFDIKTQTGQTLSTEIFSVAASCPAPIEFEAMGQQFSITFQPICDLADIIRGIILMLSAIAAIRIIVTGG